MNSSLGDIKNVWVHRRAHGAFVFRVSNRHLFLMTVAPWLASPDMTDRTIGQLRTNGADTVWVVFVRTLVSIIVVLPI